MSARPRSAGAYARIVLQALDRVRGTPELMSPKDFEYVADWHARGIPLALVLEAVEALGESRQSRGKRTQRPRKVSLARAARSVEEAWGVVLGGRTVAAPQRRAQPSSGASVRRRWLTAAQRAGEETLLGQVVLRSIRQLDEGGDAASIDRALDEALVDAAPRGLLRAIETRVDSDLRPLAQHKSHAGLATTRRHAIVDRLRETLDLPRLTESRPARGGSRC